MPQCVWKPTARIAEMLLEEKNKLVPNFLPDSKTLCHWIKVQIDTGTEIGYIKVAVLDGVDRIIVEIIVIKGKLKLRKNHAFEPPSLLSLPISVLRDTFSGGPCWPSICYVACSWRYLELWASIFQVWALHIVHKWTLCVFSLPREEKMSTVAGLCHYQERKFIIKITLMKNLFGNR